MDKSHVDRIKNELKSVGVTKYGLLKLESVYLPKIIHADEHLGGVVYGQTNGSSAMLIATDKRIIFLDRKPFFTTMDELTYDVVSGIRIDQSSGFGSIVLHTRVTDYSLRFVNKKCLEIFTKFIESRRLLTDNFNQSSGRFEQAVKSPKISSNNYQGLVFLKEHNLATFSTVDKHGNVSGAIVYYKVDENNFVYILTKSSTSKGRNVFAHSQVALTIHEAGTLQTLQLNGVASIETDMNIKQTVFDYIVKQRVYRDQKHFPPVTKIGDGTYMVIKISPTQIKYSDFSKPIIK